MGEVSGRWFVYQDEPEHRRPRDQRSNEACGLERTAVAGDRAVAARRGEGRSPAEVDETAAHRWDPVANPGRVAVAGRAWLLRTVGVGVRAVSVLAARRSLDP